MNADKRMPMKVLDLFVGCGGLSEGFLQSGLFECIGHVEWDLPMVNTLRNRLVKKWGYSQERALREVIHFDIQKTDELLRGSWSKDCLKQYGKTNHTEIIQKGLKGLIKDKSIDCIIGGPPCQAYSVAGRSLIDKDDYRNYLFENFVKVVAEFKPKLFVFENVVGLLSAKVNNELVYLKIFKAFKKIGYSIPTLEYMRKKIFNANDFGVAQTRKRVIIIGVLSQNQSSLENIYQSIEAQKALKNLCLKMCYTICLN